MSFNGSGLFQINTTGQPVIANTIISSTVFNAFSADVAVGLSTAICKDGQTATTARIPFANGIRSTLSTNASSISTGSVITDGGVGIAKTTYIGEDLHIAGDLFVGGFVSGGVFKTPEDYGAVGDGTTDDLVALNLFIDAVMASDYKVGIFGSKVYGHSTPLHNVNVSGCRFYGSLPQFDGSGAYIAGSGTVLKALGAMQEQWIFTPPVDVDHTWLSGMVIDGVGFDANSLAESTFRYMSCRYGDVNIAFTGTPTADAVRIGCVDTLSGAVDTQFNNIKLLGWLNGDSGSVQLRCDAGATGNVSLNIFERVDIVHANNSAGISTSADNNLWLYVRLACIGTATYGWEWGGSNTAGVLAQFETYKVLASSKTCVARGSVTYPANNIQIERLQTSNNTPVPTIESGASVYWRDDETPFYDGRFHDYVPTATADGTPFTSATAAGRYQLSAHKVFIAAYANIVTDGVNTGGVRLTLPPDYPMRTGSFAVFSVQEENVGPSGTATITSGSTFMRMTDFTGGYPGGNGKLLFTTGWYEID